MVVEAQGQSRDLRHHYIGTEHLLLALLFGERPPADVLRGQGVDGLAVRAAVTRIVPPGEDEVTGQIPFTPRAKKVLELSLRESLSSGGGRVMPHHLLLGLLREGEGVALQVLQSLGVDTEALRTAVLESLPPPEETEVESRTRVVRSRRGAGAAAVMASGFTVDPSPEVRRLLMSAAARALDDGRTEITIADIEAALRRRDDSEEPPPASTA